MAVNNLLNLIRDFISGKTEVVKFANDFSGLFFGSLEELEKENYPVYDILYDDDFIELLPEFKKGNNAYENELRQKATEVYLNALKVLPAEQIMQAI